MYSVARRAEKRSASRPTATALHYGRDERPAEPPTNPSTSPRSSRAPRLRPVRPERRSEAAKSRDDGEKVYPEHSRGARNKSRVLRWIVRSSEEATRIPGIVVPEFHPIPSGLRLLSPGSQVIPLTTTASETASVTALRHAWRRKNPPGLLAGLCRRENLCVDRRFRRCCRRDGCE